MDAADLQLASTLADSAPDARAAVTALRQCFPALRVSAVDAADMRGEEPVARGRLRTLWLGTNDGHCWQVTNDLARAAALFVAEGSSHES
ncbi:MAG: hypothetical protein RBR52_04825 [Thiomonas sp.]|uniref:hypothetical protein n=1 Tax=Thiomonas sp. TaxID=2047785 RepID=UPI002A35FF90|nr:hypothetical protein [Thiomonas sp.]MDY0329802.1 hypothetical protein [Thiomonas sp.]